MTAGRRPNHLAQSRFFDLGVSVVLVAVAALIWSAATTTAASAPKLDWGPCADRAQRAFECTTAKVPRSYAHPRGATIHLSVIRHRATDPAHRVGTLFFNPGGPGASVSDFPSALHFFPAALRARFDILTWDPRATGGSAGVQCFASQKDEERFLAGVGRPGVSFPVGRAEKREWIQRWRSFGRRCGRRNGELLRHLSTADSARDMNLLRRAVGVRRLNYWGISYGTFLGATYANLFPSRVRALVLDGDINPTAWVHRQRKANDGLFLGTWLRQHGDQGAAKTLDAFLDLCGRADTAQCSFSAGSAAATRNKYDALLRRLRTDPASGDISYADLASKIITLLYGPAIWPQAATCLQGLWATGHFCPPAAPSAPPKPDALSAVPVAPGGGRRYAGPEQALAIICSESPNPRPSAFRPLDGFANRRSGTAGRYWSWGSEPCSSWPASAAAPYDGPWNRRTANPVLVIGNTYDPATPYRNAKAMARQLARARLLTVDGYGHTSLTNPSACANGYATRYFVSKVLPPPRTRCGQDLKPFSGSP